MKIKKEQEVVMEVHKQKESKIHKESDATIKVKSSQAMTKRILCHLIIRLRRAVSFIIQICMR